MAPSQWVHPAANEAIECPVLIGRPRAERRRAEVSGRADLQRHFGLKGHHLTHIDHCCFHGA
jgi:hypothetical protein